ncbi:MAG: YHS domain-containing (seleno)protein [Burkholderiales bacterium]
MTRLRIIVALVALAASAAAFGDGKAPSVALKGHDPVSYFTSPRPVKGASTYAYDFDDTRYLFANAKNKELFAANPERYAPQFSGLCTTGLSMGMKAQADPEQYLVKDGKLYVFSSPQARDQALDDPSVLARASENFRK